MARFSSLLFAHRMMIVVGYCEKKEFQIDQVINGDEQKLRRKSQFIPSHVASFFSFYLSYILKKTNFGLVTCHIFTINIITKKDGLCRV